MKERSSCFIKEWYRGVNTASLWAVFFCPLEAKILHMGMKGMHKY